MTTKKSKKTDGRMFSIAPFRAIRDKKLSTTELAVLMVLGSHTNTDGLCFIRQGKIAEYLNKSRKTINISISNIRKLGYINVIKTKDKSCCTYQMLFDASPDDVLRSLEDKHSSEIDGDKSLDCYTDVSDGCYTDVIPECNTEVTHNGEPINGEPINNNIDSDSNSLNLYNKIINHYNSVLSLKSLNWTKCQSASKNKTVSERLGKELDEFGYDFIIAAIDKLSETKYGVSIAGQGKYPKVTLFFILTKLEKINSDGYAEIDEPTSDTPLDKQIHPDVQMLFDLYNSSVQGRAAHSATSISPKLHQDILNAIELYGIEELKRFIPVVCQNDYFNGENQNNDDGRVWLGSIGYFFREDKICLIMEDKQYGDPNKFKAPKPKLPKGQKVSDSRFERGLRYFVETGSWDDFSFGPEPKRGLDKRLSKLTDAQYEKYLIAKKQKG